MKKALAFGIMLALLVPASAAAHGGYLHNAAARTAASRYAQATTGDIGAASGSVSGCSRHANRVIGCVIRYEGVTIGTDLWELNEAIAVELRHGVVVVHSRLFAQ